MARFYLEQQNAFKVREQYRLKYGKVTMFENLNVVRSYLYKILRQSLRRACRVVEAYPSRFSPNLLTKLHLNYNKEDTQYMRTSP
jgi:hypothetical protein